MLKMSFTSESSKSQWEKILTVEFMSSDESGMEDDVDHLMVKPIHWRSTCVKNMLNYLDDKIWANKSQSARRQTRKRVVSTTPSS